MTAYRKVGFELREQQVAGPRWRHLEPNRGFRWRNYQAEGPTNKTDA
jgi:hypothetical protein